MVSRKTQYEDLQSRFSPLGLNRKNFKALILLPAVYAAWSDGEITQDESDEIMEIANQKGFLDDDSVAVLHEWISKRPADGFFEEGLHVLALILAAIPDEVEKDAPDDAIAVAKAVARASGGIFNIFFAIGSDEKAALEKIDGILKTAQKPAWKKLVNRLREDWWIFDWKILEEPIDPSRLNASDPFLFTSLKAIEDYKGGQFVKPNGSLFTLEDLERDLKTEVMRATRWQKSELQFRAILDQLLAKDVIVDTGLYWNNSPHAVVYEIKDNTKIYIEGEEFRLRKGRQMAFQCQMARDMNNLDGPVMTGSFSPTSSSMLCEDMSNAMMGMEDTGGMDMDDMGKMPMGEMAAMTDMPLPGIKLNRVHVHDSVKVVYCLIDTSGSMDGRPIEQVRAAVFAFLQNIPVNPKVRVGLRHFSGNPGALRGSLEKNYNMTIKSNLTKTVSQLRARGPTALYRCVNKAVDDIQRLVENDQVPKIYLIVLSDGDDTQGIQKNRYRNLTGQEALFRRVHDFRKAGIIEYLPIAYGGPVESLDRIGGPGFHSEITDPTDIIRKFASIRKHIMLGAPMQMGMS